MQATVAICTYDRPALLRLCLRGLVAAMSADIAEVVVVDNADSSETQSLVREFAKVLPLRLIEERRPGLSRARNAALESVATDYIVYLDDDAIPDATWGAAVGKAMNEYWADYFGGPYRPYYLNRPPRWYLDKYGSKYIGMKEGRLSSGQYVSGGNMGWRVSLLRRAGGFDPELGMNAAKLALGEETQLQALIQKGYPDTRGYFLPEMSMKHFVPPYKLRLAYFWRRSWAYGRILHRVDSSDPILNTSLLDLVIQTRLGMPIVTRAFVRDSDIHPFWQNYMVDYLSRHGVAAGVVWNRLFGHK